MTGTLELLCGPSGVGKSSGFGKKLRAFTYTTRRIRADQEIDGVDRIFVDDDTFEYLKESGEIFVDYEYLGNKYGFSKRIIEEVKNNNNISEQIVPFEGFMKVYKAFAPHIIIRKKLFLANVADIRLRLKDQRSIKEQTERISKTLTDTADYFNSIGVFDVVQYNYPNTLVQSQLQKINIIITEHMQTKKNNPTLLSQEIYDSVRDQKGIMLGNPYYFNNILLLIQKSFTNKNNYNDLDNSFLKNIFGVNSILTELGKYDDSIKFIENVIRDVSEMKFSENNLLVNAFLDIIYRNMFVSERDTYNPETINVTYNESPNYLVDNLDFFKTPKTRASESFDNNILLKDIEMLKIYHNYHKYDKFYDIEPYLSTQNILTWTNIATMIPINSAYADTSYLEYSPEDTINKAMKSMRNRYDSEQREHQEILKRKNISDAELEYRIVTFPHNINTIFNLLDLSIWAYSTNEKYSKDIKSVILPFIKEYMKKKDIEKDMSAKYISYAYCRFLERLVRFEEMKEKDPKTLHDDYTHIVELIHQTYSNIKIPELPESKYNIEQKLNKLGC